MTWIYNDTCKEEEWLSPWQYKGHDIKTIGDVSSGAIGFVYIIFGPCNAYYIGKKALYHATVKPPLKGRVNKRRGKKESDWLDYTGSSTTFNELIARTGHEHFKRRIQSWHYTRGELNIAEALLQLNMDCLNDDRSYNQYISLRMRRKGNNAQNRPEGQKE